MTQDSMYKFNDNGQPKLYYGNTIISFLNQEDSEIFQAAKAVQNQIKTLNLSKQLAFLPPDSFHMTVLTLCREIDRNTEYWPSALVPADARFGEVDRILKNVVDQIPMPEGVWMKADECDITKVVLKPADLESEKKLLCYRDTVAQAVGIRHSWHVGFRYHIGLDYLLDPLDADQAKMADRVCQEISEKLRKTVKPFLLPKPEFVIFNDMMSYETDLNLRGSKF